MHTQIVKFNPPNTKPRRNLLFIAHLLCALSFFTCSVHQPPPADLLRVHIPSEPSTLNPLTATDDPAFEVDALIFEGLADIDPDTLALRPKLAKRWEILPDKQTFVFHLRDDVHWQDGEPFTADDVVTSFDLINSPALNDPALKVYYNNVESVVKIDAHTVVFRYKQPYFLGLQICATMPIVPGHIVIQSNDFEASAFSRHPVGTGPYRFKSWATNSKIVLERNEDYWGKEPEIQTIEFRIIPDQAMALQMLKKGDLDVLELLSVIQWARQTNTQKFNKNFYKLAYPDVMYNYIAWNNKNPLFVDKRVRQDLAQLIDVKTINEKLNFGLGTVVTGPFFPLSKQYNSNVQPFTYNIEEGRKLLSDAGWVDHDGDGILDRAGKKFAFTFLYPSASVAAERLSTVLKEELKNVGIDMTIERLEWGAFLDKIIKREFDSFMLAWTIKYEYDPFQIWDSSQADVPGSSNFISFKNDEASALLMRARVEMNEKQRNQFYHEFHALIYDLQPCLFLYTRPKMVLVSRRFGNVQVHKTGVEVLEWRVGGE